MYKPFDEFMRELHHKKSKTPRGRRKVPIPNKKETKFKEKVAIIKPQKKN